ncbi:hypothetical protein [Thermus phage P23-45]|uniref:Uncharacterized protein n=1 Tax=Thermus virus P23-45 TaxID=2914006 RepID=A7XX88_BP234|nr:hypothetical protein P23p59 [Thermus phage P23-45]ABU96892.1 hypothetical protein P23p59 [Thermus phage P23-45]UYB98415.1 hypothetical protein [Thermus phage P23-45]
MVKSAQAIEAVAKVIHYLLLQANLASHALEARYEDDPEAPHYWVRFDNTFVYAYPNGGFGVFVEIPELEDEEACIVQPDGEIEYIPARRGCAPLPWELIYLLSDFAKGRCMEAALVRWLMGLGATIKRHGPDGVTLEAQLDDGHRLVAHAGTPNLAEFGVYLQLWDGNGLVETVHAVIYPKFSHWNGVAYVNPPKHPVVLEFMRLAERHIYR